MGTIVVGVDGSQGSVRALRYALDEARARAAEVTLVGVWHIPAAVNEAFWVPVDIDLDDSYAKAAQDVLDKALGTVGEAASGIKTTTVVREGQAAYAVCAEAEGADLLVVGSRGLGGFRGLILGSVSQQCAHHTPCPIVIVPAKPHEAAART